MFRILFFQGELPKKFKSLPSLITFINAEETIISYKCPYYIGDCILEVYYVDWVSFSPSELCVIAKRAVCLYIQWSYQGSLVSGRCRPFFDFGLFWRLKFTVGLFSDGNCSLHRNQDFWGLRSEPLDSFGSSTSPSLMYPSIPLVLYIHILITVVVRGI